MAPFDLEKMCLKWFEKQPDSNSKATVNLSRISVQLAEKVQWIESVPVTQSQRGPVRKASVKFDGKMQDILSDLEISKESATVSDVTLTDGVLKGLDGKNIALMPPALGIQAFPNGISVQPGRTRTVIKASRPNLPQAKEYTPPTSRAGVTATATITSKESSYKGRFKCTLSLDGDVIFSTGDQQDIREIIRDVQRSEQQPFFSQNSTGRTCWTLAGEVDLRWDEPDDIQWSSQLS